MIKNWPYVRLKWGLEISFGNPYKKSANTFKSVITPLSYVSQQKKVNTTFHVRQTEGLTSPKNVDFNTFNRAVRLSAFNSILTFKLLSFAKRLWNTDLNCLLVQLTSFKPTQYSTRVYVILLLNIKMWHQ